MGHTGFRDTKLTHKTTGREGKQDSPLKSSLNEHQMNYPGSDKHPGHRGGLNRKYPHHGGQKTPWVHRIRMAKCMHALPCCLAHL